jgi:hypothetical protein
MPIPYLSVPILVYFVFFGVDLNESLKKEMVEDLADREKILICKFVKIT